MEGRTLLLSLLLAVALGQQNSLPTLPVLAQDDSDCPVCIRVIRAARELGKTQKLETTASILNSYCQLSQLSVEDQKFCYNIENVRGELGRLLALGADEFRVCKRVKAMNSDFCKVMAKKNTKDGVHKNDRLVRGVVYI